MGKRTNVQTCGKICDFLSLSPPSINSDRKSIAMAFNNDTVCKLLDMFQASSLKGEWASLVLETKDGVEHATFNISRPVAGKPAARREARRKTPSQLKRDQSRQEKHFNRKKEVSKVEEVVELDASSLGNNVEPANSAEANPANDNSENESDVKDTVKYNCEECKFESTSQKGLRIHVGKMHYIKCEQCQELFKEKEQLRKHNFSEELIKTIENDSFEELKVEPFRKDKACVVVFLQPWIIVHLNSP